MFITYCPLLDMLKSNNTYLQISIIIFFPLLDMLENNICSFTSYNAECGLKIYPFRC